MTRRSSLSLFAASLLLVGCGTLLGFEGTDEYRGSPSNDPLDSGDVSVDTSVSPEAEGDSSLIDEGGDAAPDQGAAPDQDAVPDHDADQQETSADWDPLKLPGLVLWLDPSKGITLDSFGGVKEWADQSPKQHNAEQTTPDLCPQPAPLSLGGNPGVKFPGDHRNLVVTDHEDLQFGKADFLVEVVFRYKDAPAGNSCWNVGQSILAKVIDAPPFPGVVIFGNAPVASGVASDTIGGFLMDDLLLRTTYACNDNQARLVGLRRSGHTVELRINGMQEGTATPPGAPIDVSASGENLLIGGRSTAMQCVDGVIGDIIAVKGPTSESDLKSLEQWFKARYGL